MSKYIYEPRLIVALDFDDHHAAFELVENLEPARCRLKVGKEMFTRYGFTFVERLIKKGFDVFLDLKFHDIPTTVARACRAASELGVWMLNVHALGGREMMSAAREAVEGACGRRPLLVAVTILTSLSAAELPDVGLSGSINENVLRLAQLAKTCQLDGVVCSPMETQFLRDAIGKDFYLVTPGIRLVRGASDDQKRVLTPKEAIRLGADFIVVGRPITLAENPLAVISAIEEEIR